MTAWQLLAPIWFEEVTVLGPKCTSAGCLELARHTMCWPGGDARGVCDRCCAGWRRVAGALGFALHEQPLTWAEAVPPGLDDLQQRVRLIEVEL